MNTKLKPFQKIGARKIRKFKGRALLADDQGLGKTIQTLYYIRKIPNRRPVVIVTPASMKYTWQAEAALHFGMRTEVLEGTKPSKELPGDIVVINYDILTAWVRSLVRSNPQVVVFDECHYIKNPDSQRTKAGVELAECAKAVIGLSGTPLTNRPIELWSVLNVIRPDLFPSRDKFAWRYCNPTYSKFGWQFNGAAKLPELHRILRKNCMIRRMKSDVLKELPPKIRRTISFRLSSYKEYNDAHYNFLDWLKKTNPAKAKRAKKSQALVRVGYLLRLAAELKYEWTEKWIDDFLEESGEKLVVFTMHRRIVDLLHSKFGKQSVVIDGRVKGKDRQSAVRAFQNNKRVRLVIGNIRAAGEGITLTASRQTVFADLPWTPGHLVQGEDRIHRIGQKHKVTINYLVALDTIEEKLMAILRKKAAILDSILNGEKGSHEMNIFNELLEDIYKKGE